MPSDNSSPPAPAPTDFEGALAELERLVVRLERGDLPLEEALRDFERGVALTRACQTALGDAQQRVEMLVKRDGRLTTEPFDPPQNPSADGARDA